MYSQEGRKLYEMLVVAPKGLKLLTQSFIRIVALTTEELTHAAAA